MSTDADKFFSLLISFTLDNFGFRANAVSHRSRTWEQFANSMSKNAVFEVFSVGSSGEGVSLVDSDLDFMYIPFDTICLDKATCCRNFNVLQTDYNDTPPGYTKLLCSHLSEETYTGHIFIESDMYRSAAGVPYISSAVFKNMYLQGYIPLADFLNDFSLQNIETNGPAISCQAHSLGVNIPNDTVFSLLYYGSNNWALRTRFNNWPSNGTLNELSQMEGYIVPVGMKESENVNIEWRVCYTTAEKKLVRSLNDVQMKLYILLKMVAKQIKRFCKPFTSYIVKNVVFWVVEGSNTNECSPDMLLHLLEKSMRFIQHCIHNNHLPNYMIPERNLFTGAFSKQDKDNLLNYVTSCIEQSPRVFLLNTKEFYTLQTCLSYIYTCPKFVTLYGQWRDEVEKLHCMIDRLMCKYIDFEQPLNRTFVTDIKQRCENDSSYFDLVMKLLHFVVPDWWFLLLTGNSQRLYERYNIRIKFVKML